MIGAKRIACEASQAEGEEEEQAESMATNAVPHHPLLCGYVSAMGADVAHPRRRRS